MFRRVLAPIAWLLLGASLALTWRAMAADSSELDDQRDQVPSQSITISESVRGGSANATIIVSYPSLPASVQVAGRLTELSGSFPEHIPVEGLVWGSVDGRPRIVAGLEEPFAFHRDLSKGSKGKDVEFLQRFLAARGFYTGPIDSKFGSGLQTALVSFRSSLWETEIDEVLLVGDLTFVDAASRFTPSVLEVGSDISPGTTLGSLRSLEPQLQMRFLPGDASVILAGSTVEGEGFEGTIAQVDVEPLATEAGTVLTATVDGAISRATFSGEVLHVTVATPTDAFLWIPLGSVALDESGRPFAVSPSGEILQLELGERTGGFAQVLEGIADGTEVLLPNPKLITDSPES